MESSNGEPRARPTRVNMQCVPVGNNLTERRFPRVQSAELSHVSFSAPGALESKRNWEMRLAFQVICLFVFFPRQRRGKEVARLSGARSKMGFA